MAVSQGFSICCCKVPDDEGCVCYHRVAMRDVRYLQCTYDEPKEEVTSLKATLRADSLLCHNAPVGKCFVQSVTVSL